MKVRFLKAMLQGVDDESDVEVEQTDTYKCRLVLEDEGTITVGDLDFAPLREQP